MTCSRFRVMLCLSVDQQDEHEDEHLAGMQQRESRLPSRREGREAEPRKRGDQSWGFTSLGREVRVYEEVAVS